MIPVKMWIAAGLAIGFLASGCWLVRHEIRYQWSEYRRERRRGGWIL